MLSPVPRYWETILKLWSDIFIETQSTRSFKNIFKKKKLLRLIWFINRKLLFSAEKPFSCLHSWIVYDHFCPDLSLTVNFFLCWLYLGREKKKRKWMKLCDSYFEVPCIRFRALLSPSLSETYSRSVGNCCSLSGWLNIFSFLLLIALDSLIDAWNISMGTIVILNS